MRKVPCIAMMLMPLFLFLFDVAFAAPPVVLGDAEVVPHKGWETWTSLSYKRTEDSKIYEVPVMEVLYGIFPKMELGIEGAYAIEDEDGHKVSGVDFVAIQPKYVIKEEAPSFPAIAAALQFEVSSDEDKSGLEWSSRVLAPALAIEKHFGKVLLISQLKYYFDKEMDTEKYRYGVDLFYPVSEKLKLLSEVYAIEYIHSSKTDELNFRLGFKYGFMEKAKVYFAGGRSLWTVKDNRPQFEACGGLMIEF
jgi:hypothetical protein